jgi:hypothetical protein
VYAYGYNGVDSVPTQQWIGSERYVVFDIAAGPLRYRSAAVQCLQADEIQKRTCLMCAVARRSFGYADVGEGAFVSPFPDPMVSCVALPVVLSRRSFLPRNVLTYVMYLCMYALQDGEGACERTCTHGWRCVVLFCVDGW